MSVPHATWVDPGTPERSGPSLVVDADAPGDVTAAIIEGCCPVCGSRLTPVPTVKGFAAGSCPTHGVGACRLPERTS